MLLKQSLEFHHQQEIIGTMKIALCVRHYC